MALLTCPDCQKEVSDQAASCPHCGHPMRGRADRQSAPVQPAARKTSVATWGCLFLMLFGVGYCIVVGGSEQSARPNSARQVEQQTGTPIMAGIMCEDFVKQALKSPGSAKFPGAMESLPQVESRGGGLYVVSSYVDAQNGFGALIRSNWQCRIRKVPGGDNWRLDEPVTIVSR